MTDTEAKARVLFVCMGNICRSPAAEGVFREYIRQVGHADSIYIESAGTIGFHRGSLPDQRMRNAALKRGYTLDSPARPVSPDDIDAFDLIIVMDYDNLCDLRGLAGDHDGHIRLLGSYIGDADSYGMLPVVPDPYYGGEDGFEQVLDMIESACPAMLEACMGIINNRVE